MMMMMMMMTVMMMLCIRNVRQRAEIKSRQTLLRRRPGGAIDLRTSQSISVGVR